MNITTPQRAVAVSHFSFSSYLFKVRALNKAQKVVVFVQPLHAASVRSQVATNLQDANRLKNSFVPVAVALWNYSLLFCIYFTSIGVLLSTSCIFRVFIVKNLSEVMFLWVCVSLFYCSQIQLFVMYLVSAGCTTICPVGTIKVIQPSLLKCMCKSEVDKSSQFDELLESKQRCSTLMKCYPRMSGDCLVIPFTYVKDYSTHC